jgi:hypothetical protein
MPNRDIVPYIPHLHPIHPTTSREHTTITRLCPSRTEAARTVERARIIWLAAQGRHVPAIAAERRLHERTVCTWLKRFNAAGLDGLLTPRVRAARPQTAVRISAR